MVPPGAIISANDRVSFPPTASMANLILFLSTKSEIEFMSSYWITILAPNIFNVSSSPFLLTKLIVFIPYDLERFMTYCPTIELEAFWTTQSFLFK